MIEPCRACNGERTGEMVLCRACQAPYHMTCLAELGACAACQCAKVPLAPVGASSARRPAGSPLVAAALGSAVTAGLMAGVAFFLLGRQAPVRPVVTAVTETRACTVSRPPSARCQVSTRRTAQPASPAFLRLQIAAGSDTKRDGFALAIHEDGRVEFTGGAAGRRPHPRPKDPMQNLTQLLADLSAVGQAAIAAEDSRSQGRRNWNVSLAVQKNGNSLTYNQSEPNGPDPAVVRRLLEHEVDSLMGITRALNDVANRTK